MNVLPYRPMIGFELNKAREVRKMLRQFPTWKLEHIYGGFRSRQEFDSGIINRKRAIALSALEEVLSERGRLLENE